MNRREAMAMASEAGIRGAPIDLNTSTLEQVKRELEKLGSTHRPVAIRVGGTAQWIRSHFEIRLTVWVQGLKIRGYGRALSAGAALAKARSKVCWQWGRFLNNNSEIIPKS